MTAAAPSAACRTSSGSVVPPRCGTSTTSSPKPGAYVFTTWRTCGFVASVTTIFVLPGRVLRDVAGVGGDGRAVVARRVRDVHAGELADRGLVLEDRLEDALAHLGLVRRVRGQELAALHARRRRPPGRSGRRCRRRGTRSRASSRRCARRARRDARRAPARRAPARGRAGASKRTPAGMSRKSSSTDETPIVRSISSRSSSVRARYGCVTGRPEPACTPRRRAARRPRTDRRAGCG